MNHSNAQRSRSELVCRFDVGASVKQGDGDFCVTAECSLMQWGLSPLVGGFDIGAKVE